MESCCVGKVDATDVGQGVEQLRFELPALVGGNGLRASVTRYPFRYEDSGYRLRRKFHQGDGFRPARKAVYCRQAVSETFEVGRGPTMSMCRCWNRDVGASKSPSGVEACLDTFDRWQDWHVRAQARQSFCTPGHTYRCETSFAVALVPRWPRPWREHSDVALR
jgi:hypothetical protein